jgi:hypothetical protein
MPFMTKKHCMETIGLYEAAISVEKDPETIKELTYIMLARAAEFKTQWRIDIDIVALYTRYVRVFNFDLEYAEELANRKNNYLLEGYVIAMNIRYGTTWDVGYTEGGRCCLYSNPLKQGKVTGEIKCQ